MSGGGGLGGGGEGWENCIKSDTLVGDQNICFVSGLVIKSSNIYFYRLSISYLPASGVTS